MGPAGITVDAAGNVYTANQQSDTVTKITAAGTASLFSRINHVEYTNPYGITVDATSNIYTANAGYWDVTKITPAGTARLSLAGGTGPTGITIDAAGNIYTANYGSDNVTKITPSGTASLLSLAGGTGPRGITADAAGNIYTANSDSSNVTLINPNGTTSILGLAGGSGPHGITVDAAGNIYTANYGSDNVTKITPNGTTSLLSLAGGLNPIGITVDAAGNIYTANNGSNNVTKIAPAAYPAPPAKPAAPTAMAGPSSATISVTANPLSAANGAPSSYTVSVVGDASKYCTVSFSQSSCVISGLTNGTPYAFIAKANILTWQTAASSPSPSVTPAPLPDAPTSLVATAGNGSASITFAAGADNGNAITNYEYSTDDGGSWTTPNPAAATSPLVITGLTNGTPYQVKLRANNIIGRSAASTAVSVTPVTTPDAPTSLAATAGNGSTSIAFTIGANGGNAISNYEYSTDNGGSWTTHSPAATTSPIVISGLTNGTTYQIKLRAINGVGSGIASTAVSVAPATTPDAPTSLAATAGNGSTSIAFTIGANGGNAIANYEYSTDNGTTWTTRSPAAATSPIEITGLTNGTTYQIKLRAINGVGTGAASSAVSVTPTAPAPDPTPTPAAAPASAAPSAPTKPAVTWSSSTAAKTVTSVITPTNGVTYGLTATSGSTTKSGTCKNVTTKQGKTNVTRRSCTIKLGKGTWLVSVTPTKGGVAGPAATKTYAFK